MEINQATTRRWRRTWKARVATGTAAVVGVAAGAAVVAATNPASSGASNSGPDGSGARVAPQGGQSQGQVPDWLQGGGSAQIPGQSDGSFDPRGVDPDGDDWSGGRSDDSFGSDQFGQQFGNQDGSGGFSFQPPSGGFSFGGGGHSSSGGS